jgi:predicted amidohydrolase YtcJ
MPEVTLIILNANVITFDPKRPRAQAIAVQNGKIIAVGSNREIRKHATKTTKIINAKKRTIVPGLVDCHVHMTGFGQSTQTLDLRNAKSIKQIQKKLREYTKKNPERQWITGGRWDHESFREKRLPTCKDLDAVVKDKPVFLVRVCGHTGVANSQALQLAQITSQTIVEGGKVELDQASGEPNGIVKENAMDLVWAAIPKPTSAELETTCLSACQEAVKEGLTGVHWLVANAEELRILQKLHSEGKLPLRIYLGIPANMLDALVETGLSSGFGSDTLKIGFIKVFADGSLGAHTAALKEPYADKPETAGMMVCTREELTQIVSTAHKASLQVAVHAIGDRAIDTVLNVYEKTLEAHPRTNHRHRIEHCSVLNPKLITHMKRLDLIASVQPHFAISDFWTTDRVGKSRIRWVYPLKTLIREGIIVASGSDCPVELISPTLGLWAAVVRRNPEEERLTIEEALRTYTWNAAYASFDENKKGTIEAGKLADLTVLSGNILKIPSETIKKLKVEMTIVDGKVVHARKPFQTIA